MIDSNETTTASPLKKWSQWLYGLFRLNTQPTVKVYHGFGDAHKMQVFGHVFKVAPWRQDKFSSRILDNTISLLRLFMVKPYANVPVELEKYGLKTITDESGFFKFEFEPREAVMQGWHTVRVELIQKPFNNIHGEGKVMIPPAGKIGIISDIDDTFLVSHSTNLRKRLYVLFTKNAKTRQPFKNVVKHYQLLAKGDNGLSRPFFYVSSSEWNLYDYIRDFSDANKMPDGIYLLNELKEVQQLLQTGQGKHEGKYFRIARLLLQYPERKFILMGDDNQQDPTIYYKIAQDFPGQIICIYIRHVNKYALEFTRRLEAGIKKMGIEVCYHTHSHTAIEHSRRMGFID